MNTYMAFEVIFKLLSHLIFILLANYGIQSVQTDYFFKKVPPKQIRLLLTMLAVGLGYLVSSFFLEAIGLLQAFFGSFFS